MVGKRQQGLQALPVSLTQQAAAPGRKFSRRKLFLGGFVAFGAVSLSEGLFLWSISPHLQYIYRGHTAPVNAIAWSPDGTRIASGSDDNSVQVWEAAHGNLINTYSGHSDSVQKIAWSPDGTRIASSSTDGSVQMWTADRGLLVSTYKSGGAFAWSADSTYIAIAIASGIRGVQTWHAWTGVLIATYLGYGIEDDVRAIAYSPDDKHITAAIGDADTIIWDTSTGKSFQHITGTGGVQNTTVVLSPDGKHIAYTSSGDIYLRTIVTGREINIPFDNPIDAIAWSPDNKYIAISGLDKILGLNLVYVWNATTGEHLYNYPGQINFSHPSPIKSIAWSPDGKRIASGDTDGNVHVWETR